MSTPPEAETRPRASVTGSIVQGWSRALHAPWLAGAIVAAMFAVGSFDRYAVGYEGVSRPFSSWVGELWFALAQIRSEYLDLGLRLDVLFPTLGWVSHAVVYFVASIFFIGGIYDRLARARPVGSAMFSWASGHYLGRLLRVGFLVLVGYWILCQWLGPMMEISAIDEPTRFVVFLIGACLIDLLADFTTIRIVVEDRRSALGAVVAAIRFMRRRVLRVAGLYVVNVALLVLLIAAWPWLRAAFLSSWTGDFAVPLFFLLRTWSRLAFIGSEIAFFQNELAHAGYTAAPQPIWPDSPAAEAIANLTRRKNA